MFGDVARLCVFHFLCFIKFVSSGFAREKCNMRWGFTLTLISLTRSRQFWSFFVLICFWDHASTSPSLKLRQFHRSNPTLRTHPPIHFAQQKPNRDGNHLRPLPPAFGWENGFHWPRNATVYDAAHQILAQLGHVTLPQRIALAEASQVGKDSKLGE